MKITPKFLGHQGKMPNKKYANYADFICELGNGEEEIVVAAYVMFSSGL